MEPMDKEIFWALVAPNGHVQFGPIDEEKQGVYDLIDQYACSGLGMPLPALIREGYKIAQVRISIELVGELEELKDVEL